tara:strand:- start:168 stop:797 length:630 start_codon:yes stop_codon:yes gene_type:complete
MKILAIAGHADDIELAAAGSIIKHTESGDEVVLLLITHSGYASYNGQTIRTQATAALEANQAASIMGIEKIICLNYETKKVSYGVDLIEDINRVVDDIRPDLIYTHWHGDPNQDHSAIAHATLIAARNISKILMYRSNWYRSHLAYDPKMIVDISGYMDRKVQAIEAHKSETGKRGTTWIEYFKNHNRNLGIENGIDYAESFEMIKWLS